MKGKKMNKRIGTIIAACFICFTASTAIADNSWNSIAKKGRVTIGLCAQYPPFESKNEKTGELEGFDVDMGKALAEKLAIRAEFVDAEWQGLLGGLQKGDFDILITCMSKSETREKNVNFSEVYYKLPDVIVVRKGDTNIQGKADLKGKTVGVQLGTGSEHIADKMKAVFRDIKRYNYNPEAFTDLKFKRIDAVIVGYAYAVNQIKADPSYTVTGKPLAEAEIVMVMKKGADELTTRVNHALSSIKKDGTYQQIHDRWLSVE